MASENLQTVIEEVREQTYHRTTNFIVSWLRETANKSTIPEIQKKLRARADETIRHSEQSYPGNPKLLREVWMSLNPEEAHFYESTRFDD